MPTRQKPRRKRQRTTLTVSRGLNTDISYCELRYVFNNSRNNPGIGGNVFRGNGAFDPDQSGIGSQPMGFDQYGALFRRYRVTGSKIRVLAASRDGAETVGMYVVPLTTSAPSSTSIKGYTEQQYCKTAHMGRADGCSKTSLTHQMTSSKIRGVAMSAIRNDSEYSGPIGGNPNLQWFWAVGFYDLSGQGGTVTVDYQVEITYMIEFFDRDSLTTS